MRIAVYLNWFFDRIATGGKVKRSLSLRILHVILFELGLLFITIPVTTIILNNEALSSLIVFS